MKKIAVLYHANCPDGFGGAYAAWKKFGNKADYVPVRFNIEPPIIKGKDLYMVDFCYDEKHFMKRLKADNQSLTIIDHHESVGENFLFADQGVMDFSHSGAVLAWKYFNPGKKIPKLLSYIEDMDMWKFKLPGTKEILAVLDTKPQSFLVWNKLVAEMEKPRIRKEWINIGGVVLKFKERAVEKLVDKAELVSFEGKKILCVNSAFFESELGHALYTKKPPFAIMWHRNSGNIKVSLRSDGSFDISKIASKFGGGGHPGSSGFRYPANKPLPWKYINEK